MPKKPEASQWARWMWKEGLGRWHAIAETASATDEAGKTRAVARLACGRVRRPPEVTAARPSNDKCCPTCATLDDLRSKYGTDEQDKPLVVVSPTPVHAGATAQKEATR